MSNILFPTNTASLLSQVIVVVTFPSRFNFFTNIQVTQNPVAMEFEGNFETKLTFFSNDV